MIDIHSHILPGMDDGAEDTQEMLDMAAMAVSCGVTTMVTTPHVNVPGVCDNYYDKSFIESFRRAEAKLQEVNIPLQLIMGMEVFVTPDVPELIKDKKVLPINNGKYLLVEFSFDEEGTYIKKMLRKIADLNIFPVIAHPERYEYVQDNPAVVQEWKRQGYVMQANKGSFTGRFGKRAYNTAYELLEQQLLGAIASDCHGSGERTPYLKDAYEELLKTYSEESLIKLFKTNPRRICMNQKIVY